MPQAKTIKQAKAAYKSRSEKPLTEREQKQLDRSVQLDRRAWALRERERTRLESAKKRVAQDKAQQEEERRLGTQRRNDKFGFKSSQFHLGAFFRKPAAMPERVQVEGRAAGEPADGFAESRVPGAEEKPTSAAVADEMETGSEDEYEDVDDESLLEALHSPEMARIGKAETEHQKKAARPITSMPPPPRPLFAKTSHEPPPAKDVKPNTSMPPPPRPFFAKASVKAPVTRETSRDNNMPPPPRPVVANPLPAPSAPALKHSVPDSEWDDFLESGTQIARELGTEPSTSPSPHTQLPAAKEAPRTGSFSSGSFEFTEADLEELDPTPGPSAKVDGRAKVVEQRMEMPPPALPLKQQPRREVRGEEEKPSALPSGLSHEGEEPGFTMTQLESFVEDDLQLSQST